MALKDLIDAAVKLNEASIRLNALQDEKDARVIRLEDLNADIKTQKDVVSAARQTLATIAKVELFTELGK